MHSVFLLNILGTNWSAIFLVLHEDDFAIQDIQSFGVKWFPNCVHIFIVKSEDMVIIPFSLYLDEISPGKKWRSGNNLQTMITLEFLRQTDYPTRGCRRSVALKVSEDWSRLSFRVSRSLPCFDIWKLQANLTLHSWVFQMTFHLVGIDLPGSSCPLPDGMVCFLFAVPLRMVSPPDKGSEVILSGKTSQRLLNQGFHHITNSICFLIWSAKAI